MSLKILIPFLFNMNFGMGILLWFVTWEQSTTLRRSIIPPYWSMTFRVLDPMHYESWDFLPGWWEQALFLAVCEHRKLLTSCFWCFIPLPRLVSSQRICWSMLSWWFEGTFCRLLGFCFCAAVSSPKLVLENLNS